MPDPVEPDFPPTDYASFTAYVRTLGVDTTLGIQELHEVTGAQTFAWLTQYVEDGDVTLRTLEVIHGVKAIPMWNVGREEGEAFLRLLLQHRSPVVRDAAMTILEEWATWKNSDRVADPWVATFVQQIDGEFSGDNYFQRPCRLTDLAIRYDAENPKRVSEDLSIKDACRNIKTEYEH